MHLLLTRRTDKNTQQANAKLLEAFSDAYSRKNIEQIRVLLHPFGLYFGTTNMTVALNNFSKIFNGENGIKNKFHITFNEGISCDALPGEIILEIRCSDWDPFKSAIPWKSIGFGIEEDLEMNEVVHQFAFTFKDRKIFTIRTPKKAIELESPTIPLN